VNLGSVSYWLKKIYAISKLELRLRPNRRAHCTYNLYLYLSYFVAKLFYHPPTMTVKTVDAASKAEAKVKHNTAAQECDEGFVRNAVNEAVSDTIGDSVYLHEATTQWTNSIVESLVRKFVNIDRDNKYIVSCMIVQKSDAGMRSATSCFWNAQTDSGHSVT